MARIIRTSQAREDVLEIWAYIAQDNPTAADKLLRKLDETISLLADTPDIGIAQFQYRPGLRWSISNASSSRGAPTDSHVYECPSRQEPSSKARAAGCQPDFPRCLSVKLVGDDSTAGTRVLSSIPAR